MSVIRKLPDASQLVLKSPLHSPAFEKAKKRRVLVRSPVTAVTIARDLSPDVRQCSARNVNDEVELGRNGRATATRRFVLESQDR